MPDDTTPDRCSRTRRPITEDTADPVSVPVVRYLAAMPYYAAHQRYDDHAAGCPDCNGDGVMPCSSGGRLGELVWDAIEAQRRKAVCN